LAYYIRNDVKYGKFLDGEAVYFLNLNNQIAQTIIKIKEMFVRLVKLQKSY